MNLAFNSLLKDVVRGMRMGVGIVLSLTIAYYGASYAAATWGNLPNATSGTAVSSTAWNDIVAQLNGLAGAISVSNGNVGVGIATPTAPFHVKRWVGSSGLALFEGDSSSSGAPKITFRDTNGGTNDGKIVFDKINGFFLGGGNVGIGTTSAPTSKLEVNGDVKSLNTPKAWVTFNGSTMAVYDSYGVSSIARAPSFPAGGWKINWSTPFSNTYYVVTGACNAWGFSGTMFTIEGNSIPGNGSQGLFTGYAQVGCRVSSTNAGADSDLVTVVAYGR